MTIAIHQLGDRRKHVCITMCAIGLFQKFACGPQGDVFGDVLNVVQKPLDRWII